MLFFFLSRKGYFHCVSEHRWSGEIRHSTKLLVLSWVVQHGANKLWCEKVCPSSRHVPREITFGLCARICVLLFKESDGFQWSDTLLATSSCTYSPILKYWNESEPKLQPAKTKGAVYIFPWLCHLCVGLQPPKQLLEVWMKSQWRLE